MGMDMITGLGIIMGSIMATGITMGMGTLIIVTGTMTTGSIITGTMGMGTIAMGTARSTPTQNPSNTTIGLGKFPKICKICPFARIDLNPIPQEAPHALPHP